jgi:hypothetical protein
MREAATDEYRKRRAVRPPKTEAVNAHQAVIHECGGATRAANPSSEMELHIRVGSWWFISKGACPRAYGAKRVRVRIREKEGFTHPWLWRAPCFWGTYE